VAVGIQFSEHIENIRRRHAAIRLTGADTAISGRITF
jgi:hypothetical protein